MANSVITTEQATGSVLQELEDAFFDIPFENSDFQNQAFVVAAQQTPGRAYRAVGLRMFAKIRAVKEYQFSQESNQIDIDEKEAKIADEATSEFDRRRLRLDILKIQDGQSFGKKLLNDALRELNCLYAEFKKLPRYSRTQFEAEEPVHFEHRLTRQLSHNGAQESLANMRHDLPHWDDNISKIVALLELKD
jgi:hypothetical protein